MAGSIGPWAFAFGLLGNIVSFMVFLAPLPSFYQVYKKKSTEGFQSVPYVVALFSAMLWMYYAFLKANTTLLITINSVGCVIETIYICLFIFYATKKARIQTVKLLLSLNVGGFGVILLLTQFLAKGSSRAYIVGWICLIFSLCVFVAPLCILRQVIRTKSVEFMPFLLSFFLTLSAVMWFFYGLLLNDYNIAIPNVLGFFFGVLQMILYVMYKNPKKDSIDQKVNIDKKLPEIHSHVIVLEDDQKLHELAEQIVDMVKLSEMVCSEKIAVVPRPSDGGVVVVEVQNVHKESIEACT